MKIDLTARQRTLVILVCFALAIVGFMIKLPAGFRGMDKELHAAFYFGAAAFLNILLAKRNFVRHAAVFGALYLFGMAIEFGQAWSNRFFKKRIHGRFDPEDLQWNLKGLLLFSVFWILAIVLLNIHERGRTEGKT